MMLAHQHIVSRINRQAKIERENRNMDELERRAAPLFYAVMICAIASAMWHITADYRINSAEKQRENEIISAKLAACANNGTVLFDTGMLFCNFKEHKKLVALK